MEGPEGSIELMRHSKDAHQNQEVLLVIKAVKIELCYVAPGVVGAQSNYSKSKAVNEWNKAQVGLTSSRFQILFILVTFPCYSLIL